MIEYFEMLYKDSKENFLIELKEMLTNGEKKFIITANPETCSYASKDNEIKEMLLDKSIIKVPDGIGIVKAAQILDVPVKERITGIDIAEELLKYSNELKKSVYLFGAKQEVLEALKEVITKNYPNIKLLGMTNGYINNKDEEFDKLVKLKPDVVLVALGIPHQEKLIYKHLDKFQKGIFVGVGGSFDVLSGTKKRAPKIFQKLNLEWLYRITREPKRLKRFYNNNIKFLIKIKKEKRKLRRR